MKMYFEIVIDQLINDNKSNLIFIRNNIRGNSLYVNVDNYQYHKVTCKYNYNDRIWSFIQKSISTINPIFILTCNNKSMYDNSIKSQNQFELFYKLFELLDISTSINNDINTIIYSLELYERLKNIDNIKNIELQLQNFDTNQLQNPNFIAVVLNIACLTLNYNRILLDTINKNYNKLTTCANLSARSVLSYSQKYTDCILRIKEEAKNSSISYKTKNYIKSATMSLACGTLIVASLASIFWLSAFVMYIANP